MSCEQTTHVRKDAKGKETEVPNSDESDDSDQPDSWLKLQKTISHYYFNSNNCYNRTSVHIIRTVIVNNHVTHS